MVAITPETVCRARPRSVFTDCPCGRCRKQANYMRLIEYGRYTRVPASAAMRVLDMMIALGYDGRAVASACGVPMDTGHHWVRLRRKGIYMQLGAVTCAMIMDNRAPTDGRIGEPACLVAKRKLQALSRIGWGMKEIGAKMHEQGLWPGNPKGMLYMYRGGYGPHIKVKLFDAINELYRQLKLTPAPDDKEHNTVREQATAKRWPSVVAWDNINDPSCRPDPILFGRHDRRRYDDTRRSDSLDPAVVGLLCAGRRQGILPTKAERAEVVRVLRTRGKTDAEIERLSGIGQVGKRYPKVVAESKEEVRV